MKPTDLTCVSMSKNPFAQRSCVMCSPISPSPVEDRDALLAAISDVAENSLFAFADASEQAAFEAAATAPLTEGGSDWLSARVHFSGPVAGRLELTVPEPLARHLCASFSGAETPEEIGETDLVDFIGELSNMMCGTWLTRARRHDAFSLTPPEVHRGAPRGDRSEDAELFYLSIDEAPIRVVVQGGIAPPPNQERADAR
ncbi:MAG: chemotaxis protein CheX [Acidobacteriota bacterium]